MEVASKNPAVVSFENASRLEKDGEAEKALPMYEKLLVRNATNLEILARLMILARKLKKYRKEITYINKAIKIHEQRYARLKTKNVKVAALSRQLNNLLGHTDKKGKNLLEIPEVERLKKRKLVATKKLG